MPVDEKLKARILKYENIQHICSIEKYSRTDPTEEDLDDLRGAIIEISELAHKECAAPSKVADEDAIRWS